MEIELQRGFAKDIRRIPKQVQKQVASVIQLIIAANTLDDIPHLKQLSGYPNYFRIKMGQYRMGFFWDGEKLLIESFGVRGDFYKKYPPN